MVASAFLPVAWYHNKLFFLFGKEANDDTAPGFSDFGGRVERGEDLFEAGLREMAEETTGFLGGPDDLRTMIHAHGGAMRISHKSYHTHLFRMNYDTKLVKYYNNNHRFVAGRLNPAYLRKTMIFEKQELRWMSLDDMKQHRDEFRFFYREMVDKLIRNAAKIEAFVR